MKIFSAAQIRACDAYTIHASRIRSLELMERAAARCTDWLTANFSRQCSFIVLCGTGNNGGDGLAVSRMLHHLGYAVKAFTLSVSPVMSEDCAANLQRLTDVDPGLVIPVGQDTFLTDVPGDVVIIDAVFGTGLNRPPEGWIADFIHHINQLPNQKVAIDIPSGMPADTIAPAPAAIVRADHTLSFQFYKRAFLHPETGVFAGSIHILDISLDATFIQATHTNYQIIDTATVREFYKPREPFTHKGTHGTALLAGGSYGMMGALVLSARAALRAGAGKVKCQLPECGYTVLQTAAPEAMCATSGQKFLSDFGTGEQADAIGIGPGMGTHQDTLEAFEQFLDGYKEPVVLDADALNMIAKQKKLLGKVPANSILTPHPGEFERIFGVAADSMLRLELARTQAMRYNMVIVLKDRYTAVVTPEGECWYNITGNAGLATGGSGDVLTGIITALLAQQYTPVQAAMLGVYLHGVAADQVLTRQSMESMTPSDVIEQLGAAFKMLGV